MSASGKSGAARRAGMGIASAGSLALCGLLSWLGGAEAALIPECETGGSERPAGNQTMIEQVDELHAQWSAHFAETVRRFDHFFGDERLAQESDQTRVILRLGLFGDRRDEVRVQQRVRARLALPNLSRRLQLIVDSWAESEEAPGQGALSQVYEETRPDTGLRWILSRTRPVRLSVDGGLRLSRTPQAFVKGLARVDSSHVSWKADYSSWVGWYTRDRWAAEADMRWSRDLGEEWLFQSQSRLRWREREDGVTPSQSFFLFHSASPRRAHRAGVRASWPRTPRPLQSTYAVEYGLRQRLHRDWLFLEINPGFEFPQEDDYRINPFVGVFLECVFAAEP